MFLQSHELPIVVRVTPTDSLEVDIASNVIYSTTDSGTTSIDVDFAKYNADFVDTFTINTEFTTTATGSTYLSILDSMTTNCTQDDLVDILDTIFLAHRNEFTYDLPIDWYLTSFVFSIDNNTLMKFRVNLGTVPVSNDVDVDLFLSNVRYYNWKTDIFCCTANTSKVLEVDIVQGDGRVIGVPTDIYTAVLEAPYLNTSIYNATMSTSGVLQVDLISTPGGITSVPIDIYTSVMGQSLPISTEFKTRSLFIGDFFIERDSFVTASSIAWVDIVDYLYPIDIDNTFFYVEGNLASGVYFEDIPDGKRMYYNPLDDFYSDGVLNYSVHTENTIGEVAEQEFYFLYGYDLQLDEVVDWGPNSTVLIRGEATNLAFCPNTAGAAYDFTTVDLTSFNLGCTIVPVGFEDLNIKIIPQSKVFFYGKTYVIKVQNVKDFAGNLMPDLEYTFTIEDPLI